MLRSFVSKGITLCPDPHPFFTLTLCMCGQDFLWKFDKNKFVVVVFSMFIRKLLSLFQVINVYNVLILLKDHIKFTNQFYEVKSHIISEFSTKGWRNSSFRGEETLQNFRRRKFREVNANWLCKFLDSYSQPASFI